MKWKTVMETHNLHLHLEKTPTAHLKQSSCFLDLKERISIEDDPCPSCLFIIITSSPHYGEITVHVHDKICSDRQPVSYILCGCSEISKRWSSVEKAWEIEVRFLDVVS
jgi:hypothetical protein